LSAILLDSSIVHYEVLGRGRPVIFLHGWVGSWRYWITSMQVTSTSYRAYALDLWGFGDTAHDPNTLKYSLDAQASLIDRFLIEMGIGKIALVGHGLGGLVGMTFAAKFPQSVDRMMAVSCPLDYLAVNARLKTASPGELSDWLSSRTPEATAALSDTPKTDAQAISTSLVGLQSSETFSKFRALNIPCLLVYGDKDPAITTPDGEYSLSTMTHQIEMESSGHFPMIDETSRFNRLLTDFLALDSGASPRELQMKDEWRRRVR
jgi:pimeloyl-ACP methyl ester carboxylesterase